MTQMNTQIKAFAAGFVSTLVFHQGLIALLFVAGIVGRSPWSLDPVQPLGIPAVVSLAFWGGLWGIALYWMIRRQKGTGYWLAAGLLGALLPTLVALFVVVPLKGGGLAAAGNVMAWMIGFAVNAAWGLGCALLMRLFGRIPD